MASLNWQCLKYGKVVLYLHDDYEMKWANKLPYAKKATGKKCKNISLEKGKKMQHSKFSDYFDLFSLSRCI